jgi:hypothetical protein
VSISSLNNDNIFKLILGHDHFKCNIEKFGAETNLLSIFLSGIIFLDLTNILKSPECMHICLSDEKEPNSYAVSSKLRKDGPFSLTFFIFILPAQVQFKMCYFPHTQVFIALHKFLMDSVTRFIQYSYINGELFTYHLCPYSSNLFTDHFDV